MWVAWSGAVSHLLATDTLSSPVLYRALRSEKAVFHARFVGGQVPLVNIASSSVKWHSHRHRDCCNACLPHHCAPSAWWASSRIEVALGRARKRHRPAWPASWLTWPPLIRRFRLSGLARSRPAAMDFGHSLTLSE